MGKNPVNVMNKKRAQANIEMTWMMLMLVLIDQLDVGAYENGFGEEESAGKCRNYSDDAAASENGLRARYMNYLDVDDVAVNCPTRCLVLLKMGLVGKRVQAGI